MDRKPNNRKYRGKYNDTRKNVRKDEAPEKLGKQKYNDPSWYTASAQLAKDVGSLSFNNALGAQSIITGRDTGTMTLSDFVYRSPGIMTIWTAPAFGVSTGGHSALNLAAKNFYSWIRHANSGHSNYDSPDLMLYLGAMDSIYSLIAYFQRMIGVSITYSQVNRYIGDAALHAMGVDPMEVRSNIAQLRSWLNTFITKVSAFATPDTMNIFRRHFWMYSGMYKDEPVTKSQYYMYVPSVLWKYIETDGAGHLEATNFTSGFSTSGSNAGLYFRTNTLAELQTKANQMLAAIVASEDMNIMSGDILKAYGDRIWKLNLIPEDYSTIPVYSEEILDQIHNTRFCGSFPISTLDLTVAPNISLERLNVAQDAGVGDGALIFMPQFRSVPHVSYDCILDMHSEQPTPEEVLVASRNLVIGNASITTNTGTVYSVSNLETCGSDLCLWASVFTTGVGNTGYNFVNVFTSSSNPASSFDIEERLSAFNKRPHAFRISNNTGAQATGLIGEIDNYTVLSHDDVARIHDSALLSLLAVPYLGTASQG